MTDNLVRVQGLLGPRVGRDVLMYSISLQPEHDTPGVLADYAKRHSVGPGGLLLTGRPAAIELPRHRLGSDPVRDANLEEHLGRARFTAGP